MAERLTAPIANRIEIRRAEREIVFPRNGRLAIYSADSPDSIRGESFHVVIEDEAARISEEAHYDAILPTLADHDGTLISISTPKGRNWFYNEWVRARADGKAAIAFQAPTNDNPSINIRAAFERARTQVPERTFQQEWLAQFVEDNGLVFRRVRDCATVQRQDAPRDGHRYVFGVDWGKANDYTVISVLDETDKALVYLDRFNQIDYAVQRGRLRALYDRFNPSLVIAEQNSIGDPIIEQLRRDGVRVRAFQTTNETKRDAIEALALAFERGDIRIIPDETLINELQAYELERLPSGNIRYNAPAGLHDDCVMSLAIAWSTTIRRAGYGFGG